MFIKQFCRFISPVQSVRTARSIWN